jgi:uncharacterized protein Yka (UPF0111/DUF47 family)
MKALRKLLGYDDRFYDLLESSAVEAQSSVGLLVDILNGKDGTSALDAIVEKRRKDKRITEEITEQLCKTFVTPLDREDIEALSTALYKIPKTVEKFSEIFLLCRDDIGSVDFSRQAVILQQATGVVVEMVGRLRSRANLETMKDHNSRLHRLEGEADKLMMDLIKGLYRSKHDPLQVIIVLDLYEILERIIDRCRDAGNVIFQVVLKYS